MIRLFMRLAASFMTGVLAFGSVAASARPDGGEPVQIGMTYTIAATAFQGDRRLTIRLPSGYAEQPDMRFPVVYLIDGGPQQDFPHIAGIAQSRDMNGSFERFILVGIETVNRRAEISPAVRPEALELYKQDLGATPGGSDNFRAFIANDVKPWVNANFRTNGHDAVMGESLAGLFIIETLLTKPDLFDDWIAVSPSMWFDDMKIARGAAVSLAQAAPGAERLYLTVANEGYRHEEGIELFVDALRSNAPKSWKWAYVPMKGTETHGTIYHTAALDSFRLLYGAEHREYRPYDELAGETVDPRTDAEQAILDTPCTKDNSIVTTPGAAALAREDLFYRCLRLDLGPIAREGNLTP